MICLICFNRWEGLALLC